MRDTRTPDAIDRDKKRSLRFEKIKKEAERKVIKEKVEIRK